MNTRTTDPFFEDEEDLARSQAARPSASASAAKKPPKTTASPASAVSAKKPPSFALVVAIAVVALLLGVGIGYFWAMAVVDRSGTAQVQTTTSPTISTGASSDEEGMPEGHPDISAMMNPDGSINEDAVEAFKAQRAASQQEQDDTAADAA